MAFALLVHVQSIAGPHRSLMGSGSLCSLYLQFAKSFPSQRGADGIAILHTCPRTSPGSRVFSKNLTATSPDTATPSGSACWKRFLYTRFSSDVRLRLGCPARPYQQSSFRIAFAVVIQHADCVAHLIQRFQDSRPSLHAAFTLTGVKHARSLLNVYPCNARRRNRESAVGD